MKTLKEHLIIKEANDIKYFLAGKPIEDECRTTKDIAKQILLDGKFLYNGKLLNPTVKHLGCGVYSVKIEENRYQMSIKIHCDICNNIEDYCRNSSPIFNKGCSVRVRGTGISDNIIVTIELCKNCRKKLLDAYPDLKERIEYNYVN